VIHKLFLFLSFKFRNSNIIVTFVWLEVIIRNQLLFLDYIIKRRQNVKFLYKGMQKENYGGAVRNCLTKGKEAANGSKQYIEQG